MKNIKMKNKKTNKEILDFYNRESKRHRRVANITFALIFLVIALGYFIYLK
jgi:uncharacterized membrane protein YozB (DUF420 family)